MDPQATRMKQVAGKVALIAMQETHDSCRIAGALARAGVRVLIANRESAHAAVTAWVGRHPGLAVSALSLDVTDRGAVDAAARTVLRDYGGVHILCSGPCPGDSRRFAEVTLERWHSAFGASVDGLINLLTGFLPGMKARREGGHVVNLVTSAALVPSRGSCVEATSGFAVRGLTESLRFSLARHGIGVSLVCSAGSTGEAVGDLVLACIQNNEPFVCDQPELLPELVEASRQTLAALPAQAPDAGRAALEGRRRAAKRAATRAFEQIS